MIWGKLSQTSFHYFESSGYILIWGNSISRWRHKLGLYFNALPLFYRVPTSLENWEVCTALLEDLMEAGFLISHLHILLRNRIHNFFCSTIIPRGKVREMGSPCSYLVSLYEGLYNLIRSRIKLDWNNELNKVLHYPPISRIWNQNKRLDVQVFLH